MEGMPYSQIAGLEHIYLEDSYVLGIHIGLSLVQFSLLVVLNEKHPDFTPPPNDQQYCYRKALLSFQNVKRVEGLLETVSASTDCTGTTDYGNVDEFYLVNDRYHLSGDWGKLVIESTPPSLQLEDRGKPR